MTAATPLLAVAPVPVPSRAAAAAATRGARRLKEHRRPCRCPPPPLPVIAAAHVAVPPLGATCTPVCPPDAGDGHRVGNDGLPAAINGGRGRGGAPAAAAALPGVCVTRSPEPPRPPGVGGRQPPHIGLRVRPPTQAQAATTTATPATATGVRRRRRGTAACGNGRRSLPRAAHARGATQVLAPPQSPARGRPSQLPRRRRRCRRCCRHRPVRMAPPPPQKPSLARHCRPPAVPSRRRSWRPSAPHGAAVPAVPGSDRRRRRAARAAAPWTDAAAAARAHVALGTAAEAMAAAASRRGAPVAVLARGCLVGAPAAAGRPVTLPPRRPPPRPVCGGSFPYGRWRCHEGGASLVFLFGKARFRRMEDNIERPRRY